MLREEEIIERFPFYAKLGKRNKEYFLQKCNKATFSKKAQLLPSTGASFIFIRKGALNVFATGDNGEEGFAFRVGKNEACFVSEKLIYGLGISLTRATDEFIARVKKYPNAVIHIINGVQSMSEVRKLYDHNLKILILGYKMFRRGIEYFSEAVDATKNEYYAELGEMLKHFDVVSFDNLALKQLETKRLLSEDQWNEFYMGDDGSHTMYIDCINKQFARSSVAPVEDRRDLMDDIKPMFDYIRGTK